MCMAWGEGGEWMRGLGLGFTNPVGTAGVSFVFTDVTQKYTITHNTTVFAILGTKQ